MSQFIKHPRTPHLPWSPGATPDDINWTSDDVLDGQWVVVTEKMDGENCTMYKYGIHARSIESAYHPSRTWVSSLQASIGYQIPENMRVCGENLYAKHSLSYDNLDSYFLVHSIWETRGDLDYCLSWDDTVAWTKALGLFTVPVLWTGVYETKRFQYGALSIDTSKQEGYVVRPIGSFMADRYTELVAKWVRPAHVETDDHWMHTNVIKNGLKKSHLTI
jgi:RNA ligase